MENIENFFKDLTRNFNKLIGFKEGNSNRLYGSWWGYYKQGRRLRYSDWRNSRWIAVNNDAYSAFNVRDKLNIANEQFIIVKKGIYGYGFGRGFYWFLLDKSLQNRLQIGGTFKRFVDTNQYSEAELAELKKRLDRLIQEAEQGVGIVSENVNITNANTQQSNFNAQRTAALTRAAERMSG